MYIKSNNSINTNNLSNNINSDIIKEDYNKITETYDSQNQGLSTGRKIKYSFYAALIFFFVSSPMMYQLTQKINGHFMNVLDNSGCPSNSGLLLHTFIYFIIIFFTMIIS